MYFSSLVAIFSALALASCTAKFQAEGGKAVEKRSASDSNVESEGAANTSPSPQPSASPVFTGLTYLDSPSNVQTSFANGHPYVSWNAVANALSYNIYRQVQSGSTVLIATGITATSLADIEALADPRTNYRYQVVAIAGALISAASPVVSVRAPFHDSIYKELCNDAEVGIQDGAASAETYYLKGRVDILVNNSISGCLEIASNAELAEAIKTTEVDPVEAFTVRDRATPALCFNHLRNGASTAYNAYSGSLTQLINALRAGGVSGCFMVPNYAEAGPVTTYDTLQAFQIVGPTPSFSL